jgi:hypothetical protein
MRPHASRTIDRVASECASSAIVNSIVGERVVIGVVGIGDVTACLNHSGNAGSGKCSQDPAPYKFVSREFKKEPFHSAEWARNAATSLW